MTMRAVVPTSFDHLDQALELCRRCTSRVLGGREIARAFTLERDFVELQCEGRLILPPNSECSGAADAPTGCQAALAVFTLSPGQRFTPTSSYRPGRSSFTNRLITSSRVDSVE
jgi:hypothetical protein